jgi:hypothetical protein
VITGNHFFLDAVVGAALIGVAYWSIKGLKNLKDVSKRQPT